MIKKNFLVTTLFAISLLFITCDKNDPVIPVEPELITTVHYTLTPTGGGTSITLSFQDLDGDGDLDLVVAEFGLVKSGRILLLENQGVSNQTPNFEVRVLDPRHGAIHTPVVDLNRDGLLDFVALISQEHETVDAFLNDGQGGFTKEIIFPQS